MTRPVDPSTPEATTKVLEKVRALLAKAESTEFAEEAAAFTAKAQAIMAAHSITLAMLEGASPDDGPASLRIVQEAPYASQKSTLLSAIARPNQCRVVWDSRDRSSLAIPPTWRS